MWSGVVRRVKDIFIKMTLSASIIMSHLPQTPSALPLALRCGQIQDLHCSGYFPRVNIQLGLKWTSLPQGLDSDFV